MIRSEEPKNNEFIRCWKEVDIGNKEVGKRFNMALRRVKALKSRLR